MNDGMIHAGNFAYTALLAIFPFCIVMVAILTALGQGAQSLNTLDALFSALPPVVTKVLEPAARDAMTARSGAVLWIGAFAGLWTASNLVETLRDMLRRAYGTQPSISFWRYRLLSTAVIIGTVFLLLLSLFAQVMISAAQEAISAWFPTLGNLALLLTTSRLIPAALLYLSIFGLFLSLTPSHYRGKTFPKWPGALLVTVWWIAITLALPIALRHFLSYDLTYGSLAGVIIVLFFFWLVGLGMVAGAELNAALTTTPEEQLLTQKADQDNEPNTN